jgi:FtsZ-binding cell division protein ZapB
MIALPTVDTQHLPLHQRNQQQRVHPPPIPIPSPQPYPSSMIPFWPSSNQPTHPEVNSVDHKPPIHKHADRYQSAIDGLDWNTQSFMTNAPSHPSATEANSLTTSVASSSAGDENAALRRRSGSNETAVSRLLDTIAKLKEENRRLSSQNQQVQQEMQSFRHEYEEKLREVKHLIQSGHQNRTAAALSSSEIEGISKLNEALEVALRREKKYQQRHADLEKLVIGLTKKYDTLKEDSQRKDALIQKLQCTPQSSTSGDSVHSTHVQREASIPTGPTMQSPSVLSSSSVGIAGPLSPGNNNSRNPMSASGNLLPYGRRPATTAKHPAAVTLESLQKSTKHVK